MEVAFYTLLGIVMLYILVMIVWIIKDRPWRFPSDGDYDPLLDDRPPDELW
jgi:hypothetical protein